MATGFPYFHSNVETELGSLRRAWGWLLAWGLLQLFAGTAALVYPVIATVIAVEVFGILLLIGAGVQFVGAFYARGWGGVLTSILCGILYLFAGVVLIERPLLGAAGYTLFLSMLFFAIGALRIVAGIGSRYSGWGWAVFSGIISILLALLIWQGFPGSSLWVIGTFVGIELLFAGWFWVMLALGVRRLPSGPVNPSV